MSHQGDDTIDPLDYVTRSETNFLEFRKNWNDAMHKYNTSHAHDQARLASLNAVIKVGNNTLNKHPGSPSMQFDLLEPKFKPKVWVHYMTRLNSASEELLTNCESYVAKKGHVDQAPGLVGAVLVHLPPHSICRVPDIGLARVLRTRRDYGEGYHTHERRVTALDLTSHYLRQDKTHDLKEFEKRRSDDVATWLHDLTEQQHDLRHAFEEKERRLLAELAAAKKQLERDMTRKSTIHQAKLSAAPDVKERERDWDDCIEFIRGLIPLQGSTAHEPPKPLEGTIPHHGPKPPQGPGL